ncbi:MAG TPA: divergent PAP2 family protein [Candidatus Saccharimonadia bacterium]|nr:divergent PAP2 family protein [Candidatus Saccharimonadia bacterium]
MSYNPYIVIPFATWAVAQITKFAIAAFKGKIDFRYLYASGGMPSVHSAVVSSLAVTALLVGGVQSQVFGFAIIFAAIVMYDSFGVRRSAGEQAAAINMLIESLDRNRVKLEEPNLHIREILGHQPREVTAGAFLGIALALLFNYQRLGAFGAFMQTVPKRPELIVYASVFVALLIIGLLSRWLLRARYPKSKVIKTLTRRIVVATQTVGWLGIVSVALVYERASYFAWRLWPLLILLIGVVWAVSLFVASYKTVPATLAIEANEARKMKWLNFGRNKGKKKPKRAS